MSAAFEADYEIVLREEPRPRFIGRVGVGWSERDPSASSSARRPLRRDALPDLLTKSEAAAYLRISERSFERWVLPEVTRVCVGAKVLFEFEELERWLEGQRVGPSTRTSARGSSSSASRTQGVDTSDPRVRAIAAELRSKPLKSTTK